MSIKKCKRAKTGKAKGAKQMNDFNNIPQELRQHDNWVCWRLIERSGNKTKIPFNALTGAGAKSNEPETWTSYEAALQALNTGSYDGVGFMFSNSPFVGIDIDHCIEGGKLSPVAAEIVQQIGSYTEISPSGSGLHIIAKGQRPAEESRDKSGLGLEMYSEGRYFTITGRVHSGLTDIREAQGAVSEVHKKYFAKEKPPELARPLPNSSTLPPTMADNEIIQKAINSKGGEDFATLNAGQWQALGYPSQSEADQAFCNKLAFWTGKDAAKMDAIFRQSGLMRGKWDIKRGSQTYGEMTIGTAIRNCGKVYEGPKPPPVIEMKPAIDLKKPEGEKVDDNKEEEKELTEEEKRAQEEQRTGYTKYMASEYINFLFENAKACPPAMPTGFEELDGVLDGGLYAGLYCVGAISSLGKTTFVLQIADQVAKQGHDALIFSLEMSRYELIAKSISRTTLEIADNPRDAKGIKDISVWNRFNNLPQKDKTLIKRAGYEYGEYAENIRIIEGMGNVTVSKIKQAVARHIQERNKIPVVVIDYLQLIAPEEGQERATPKQVIDKAVMELKRISRDHKTPVIAISSLNRQSYQDEANMASFKESGAIEYSSDVLIGLQLKGVGPKDFDADAAKAKNPREIELVVLKNRNGMAGGRLEYEYRTPFHCFKEIGPAKEKTGLKRI